MTKKKLPKFVRANVLSVQSVIQGNGRGEIFRGKNGQWTIVKVCNLVDNISTSRLSLTSSEHLGRFIREIAAGKKLIEDFSVCLFVTFFSLCRYFSNAIVEKCWKNCFAQTQLPVN